MTGTAVAKKEPRTAVQLLDAAKADIAAVLPAHMDPEKIIRGVRLALAQKPDLASCDPKTVLFAVMHLARIGLEPNTPLHQASLVAYGKECVPMIEFRGFQDLARNSGEYRHIDARNVVEGDFFEWTLGTNPGILHKPVATDRSDTKITHVYAIAFPKEGPPVFDVLTRDEVERARSVSRMKDGVTWTKWYGEMCRKTAVRRLAKYLRLSPELAAAIELDQRVETGELGSPSALLDTPEEVAAHVRDKTSEKTAEIKGRLAAGQTKGASPSPEVEVGSGPPPPSGPETQTVKYVCPSCGVMVDAKRGRKALPCECGSGVLVEYDQATDVQLEAYNAALDKKLAASA